MYLCKVKMLGFGKLKLKIGKRGSGFLFLVTAGLFLSLFSCKNEEEVVSSVDWEGNWTIVEGENSGESGERAKPYTGTIKVKSSDKEVIVMSGSLFGLSVSDLVEAEVSERLASFDKQTDDYRIVGTGELKNINEIRFEFSIARDNEVKDYIRIAVKIQ